MARGTVKWFNNAKGYGFILPANGGEDLFAHFSAIQMEGYKTLKAGQSVEYEVVEGDKGLHALNIQMAEPEIDSPAVANAQNNNAASIDIHKLHDNEGHNTLANDEPVDADISGETFNSK